MIFSSSLITLSLFSSRLIVLTIINRITIENGAPPMMVPVWTVSTTALPPRVSSTVVTDAMLNTRMTRNHGPDCLGAETKSASAYVPASSEVT